MGVASSMSPSAQHRRGVASRPPTNLGCPLSICTKRSARLGYIRICVNMDVCVCGFVFKCFYSCQNCAELWSE